METAEEGDGVFVLEFLDEVRVVEAQDLRLVGCLGAVLGRAKDDAEGVEWYAISVDGEPRTWMLPLHHLVRTGNRRSRENYYPG